MSRLESLVADWPAISALLDEALALPATERHDWVAALSGDHARFRPTLQGLLAARSGVETGDFLSELPAVPGLAAPALPGEPAAGGRVGPYQLVSELGRGGMGTVWLADRADGQFTRRVALKLPRVAWGGALAERMARERDILASLVHPHIARLYDAGTDEHGRPYLAMEHVDGEAIDAHCRSRALPLRPRLELLLQVCAAVAHAHAHLVVHRDLKPGNILVTAQGQVRLLDFGIAKLMEGDRTAETALTQWSGRALSLDYASPEQIRGDPLGTASDVYSLAVVAYELLAGSRPYRLRRGSAAELEEAIASTDPPRASEVAAEPTLARALRGDLDAILGKALRKNPADRYPTVVALAEDLQRHLSGHVVLARPEGRLYRARKFVGRHRVWVAALSTAMLALTVGLGVALWQTQAALRNEQSAQRAVDREGAVKMLMMDTLSAVASAGPAGLQAPGAVGHTMVAKLAEYEQRFSDRPEQRLGLLEAVAVQLPFFGDYAGSLDVGQRYLALLRAMKSDDWRVLRAHLGNARALSNLQRLDEAQATLREALATVPDTPEAINNRVAVMAELGKLLTRTGQRDEAKEVLAAAVRRIDEFDDRSIRWDARMALARLSLGFDDPAALALMAQAHEEYLRFPQAQSSEVGASFGHVGWALRSVGRRAEAEKALAEGHRRFEQVFGTVDRDTVAALARWAASLADQGRYDEARQALAQRRRDTEERPGGDTAGALLTLNARQLETELMHGDLKAASRHVAARADPAALSLASARDTVVQVVGEAQYLGWTGRAEDAEQRLRQWLQAQAPTPRWTADAFRVHLALADALLAQGRARPALEVLDTLTAAMRQLGAQRSWPYRQALELSALARLRVGEPVQALALLAAVDTAGDGLQAPSRVAQADSAVLRAQVLLAAGRRDAAAAAVADLAADLAGQHPDSPRLAAARRTLANVAGLN